MEHAGHGAQLEAGDLDVLIGHAKARRQLPYGEGRLGRPQRGAVDAHLERLRRRRGAAFDAEALDSSRKAAGRGWRAGGVVHRDDAVAQGERVNAERRARRIRIRRRLRHEQRRDVPRLALPPQVHHRRHELDAPDDDAVADEVDEAVLELQQVEADDGFAVTCDPDVVQLHTAPQTAFDTPDDELPVDELCRLAHRVPPQPVAEPGRLRDEDGHDQQADEDRREDAEGTKRRPDPAHVRRPVRSRSARASGATRACLAPPGRRSASAGSRSRGAPARWGWHSAGPGPR